jgi:RNA polymerase sigma-70 factor (ECF subfamily)
MTQDAAGMAVPQASGFLPLEGPDEAVPFDNRDEGDASLEETPEMGSGGTAADQSCGAPGLQVPDRDTEVFNRFLAGNDEAYRVLYDLHERPLYLYILRLVGSEGDAQDVFQDVWIRMFRLRGERKSVTRFSGLLFTVARNLSINAIRNRKLLPNTSIEDVSADTEPSLRTREVDDSDLREMLERALAQLPVAQREAFILREYNGYSYQEIAEITSTAMVTAKTRAWRARERLRKVISAWLDLKVQS